MRLRAQAQSSELVVADGGCRAPQGHRAINALDHCLIVIGTNRYHSVPNKLLVVATYPPKALRPPFVCASSIVPLGRKSCCRQSHSHNTSSVSCSSVYTRHSFDRLSLFFFLRSLSLHSLLLLSPIPR